MSQIVYLYDINKELLTNANISGLNNGLYSITLSGAGIANFFFDPFGVISANMTTILFYTKSPVTLTGTVEYYTEGDWYNDINWIGCRSYDFNLSENESNYLNTLYPTTESHFCQPKRLSLTSSGPCTIWCKISIS